MRTNQLKAFDAVALEGSFSQAAIRLGVTQPAVTFQVRKLEQDYGCLLFTRDATGARLTVEGRELLQITRRLFTAEQEAREYLDATEKIETGSLRLAADAPQFVLDLLAVFVAKHANIQVSMRFGNAREVRQDLAEKRVDAIVTGNPDFDDRFAVMPFHRHELCAILPVGHSRSGQKTVDVRDLEDSCFLMRERISNTRLDVDNYLKNIDFHPTSVMELGGREAIKEATAKGFGVGFMFRREAEGDARIVAIPLVGPPVLSVNALVCLKAQLHRRIIKELMQTAQKLAGCQPGAVGAS